VEGSANGLRVLFCFGVLPAFFETDDATRVDVGESLREAYSSLEERYGIRVIGTLDDDRGMVGPSFTWPWTCYILADAPDHDAVTAFCDILRQARVGEDRLWRYLRVEARVGRELFFGAS
jgi:hypothetical protein